MNIYIDILIGLNCLYYSLIIGLVCSSGTSWWFVVYTLNSLICSYYILVDKTCWHPTKQLEQLGNLLYSDYFFFDKLGVVEGDVFLRSTMGKIQLNWSISLIFPTIF